MRDNEGSNWCCAMREEERKNDQNIAELKCPGLWMLIAREKTVPQEEQMSLEFEAE